MNRKLTLTAMVCGSALATAPAAQAQCYHPAYIYHSSHRHDSCAVQKPLVPGRFGGYIGLLGMTDRRGTGYLGGDLQGYYWLLPRWSTGLRGTFTGEMPAADAPAEVYVGTAQPRLLLYSITWNNSVVLADGPRWRWALQAGAGLGGANLYDKARQVQAKGRRCGCTTAELMASATAPVAEVGLAATYKLKRADGPWLTLHGTYRQWGGTAPFGAENQFSTYMVSMGISVPDAPAKRK